MSPALQDELPEGRGQRTIIIESVGLGLSQAYSPVSPHLLLLACQAQAAYRAPKALDNIAPVGPSSLTVLLALPLQVSNSNLL